MAPETLRETLARLARAGYRLVLPEKAPLDARHYAGPYYEDSQGRLWKLLIDPAGRRAAVAPMW